MNVKKKFTTLFFKALSAARRSLAVCRQGIARVSLPAKRLNRHVNASCQWFCRKMSLVKKGELDEIFAATTLSSTAADMQFSDSAPAGSFIRYRETTSIIGRN